MIYIKTFVLVINIIFKYETCEIKPNSDHVQMTSHINPLREHFAENRRQSYKTNFVSKKTNLVLNFFDVGYFN